jgi:hypothetical protein
MKWIYVLAFLTPQLVFASTMDCENYTPSSSTSHDGKVTSLLLPGSKIFASPSWSPNLGLPPLSVPEAFELVTDWAPDNLPRYDSIEIRSIEVRKYDCFVSGNNKPYWYYIVEYVPSIEGNRLYGGANYVSVMMSGEIIKPTRK